MPDKDPNNVVEKLVEIAQVIGKYGVSAVIFAFPPLMGSFGLYFMWMTMNESQLNAGKASLSIFAVLFGSGFLILLLYLFKQWDLWERLGLRRLNEDQSKLDDLEARVHALEEARRAAA
jgi:hypothetical protein